MSCAATTRQGTPCKKAASFPEGYCGTHHNSLYASDAAYRARYEAYVNAIPERRRQEDERRAARMAAETAAAVEQERLRAEQVRRESERRREELRVRHQEIRNNAPNSTPAQIIAYTRGLVHLWDSAPLEGFDIIRVYIALKYRTSRHEGFDALIRATVTVIQQTAHPDYAGYRQVPLPERQEALAALVAALAPYGEIRIEDLPVRDAIHPLVQTRIRQNAEREAAARRDAERVAREAQLLIDLRERPVVFQRDPEGGIHLRQFANDAENVHRSSVQETTHKNILTLLQRPLREGQETLSEVLAVFNERRIVRFSSERVRERVTAELTHDYFETEAFSTKYGDVLDRVWAYIHPHEHRIELILRLAQEVCDGLGVCSNGKMAHLVNVLQGFDETLEFDLPRELFQTKFERLRHRPVAEREAAANDIFREFHIPEEERNEWLTPLMEEPEATA